MVRIRAALNFVFLFSCALSASAATITYGVLLDTDNSPSTGCSVSGVSGIDQVLITTVNVSGTSGTVAGVVQQQCSAGVLSSPVTIDNGGWPITISGSGKGIVETRMPLSLLGGHVPAHLRLAFSATTGAQTAVVSQLPNGAPILWQADSGRHRAAEPPGGSRTIVLDGNDADWAGVPPLVSGAPATGSAGVRFFNIYSFASATDLFFLFDARPGGVTANNDSFSVRQGSVLTVVAPGVLANDSSTSGASLRATAVTAPSAGSLVLNPDGSFTYIHNGSAVFADSFQYKASDGFSDSTPATVAIAIVRDNPPTAIADTYTVVRGQSITVPAPGVLANDTDPEHDALTARIVAPPTHGTLTLDSNGGFRYTHDDSASTTDSFSYSARDRFNTSAPVVDTITVLPRNHAPSFTAGPDQVVLDTSGAQSVANWATAITPGPADEASQLLNFVVTNNNAALFTAQPAISPAGTLTFTPAVGQIGDATVTVALHDNGGTANGGVDTSPAVTFVIHVEKIPVITSAAATAFTTGVAGTFTVTSTGRPAATILEAGTLPAGVAFTSGSPVAGSATLAGTPAAGSGGVYNLTFTATNSHGSSTPQNFVLTVNQPPAITSTNAATFTTGVAATFNVVASGYPAPALTLGGSLPSGLSFVNNGNGTAVLSGTPAAGTGGLYALTITASNGVGSAAVQSFALTVDQPPAFTSLPSATFVAGSQSTATVVTTGTPAAAITISSGALPSGLTLVDNHNGTASLTGTPAAGSAGAWNFVLMANNGIGSPATQNYTLTVNQAPAITSANAATFTTGLAGTFSVAATGFPAPALSAGGALPSGVTFVDNGNGTAVLSGTPAAGTGGLYAITITASNGVGSAAVQSFALTVDQSPAFTSSPSATFVAGSQSTATIVTTGTPAAAITISSGTLPSGVTLVDNHNGTASLTGTPSPGSAGPWNFVLTANNGIGSPVTQNYTLTVNQAPAITSANAATFASGLAGTFNVAATGYPAPALTVGGALPSGLSFVDNGNGTAVLSGTPAAGTGGLYAITITASNGVGSAAAQSFTLTVDQPPAFTSSSSATFVAGSSSTATIVTTGYPAATITISSGPLPSGVSLIDNHNGTASLTGTPAAGSGGTWTFVLNATNGVGSPTVQTYTMTVNQAPAITSGNTAAFTAGAAGSFAVTTSGFPTAVALSESGVLPSGVTFVDNGNGTATVAGTPATGTGGAYPITISGSNGVAPNASQQFTLTVDEAAKITSATNTIFTAGSAGTFSVTTSGFPTGAAMLLSQTGTLPSGVTFTDNHNGTATIAGTATATGDYAITIAASNGIAPAASQNFTLHVYAAPAITSASGTAFTINLAGTFAVTATGFPTPSLSENGARPAGVTFTDNGNGTATIAGIATVTGNFPITITASNGVTPNATQNFTLTIQQAPAITSAASTTFAPGKSGQTFTVTTTGFPAAAITTSGTFPTGVALTDNHNGTATISGTPAAGTAGASPYSITITANNGVTPNATQNFTLNITCPTITVSGGPVPQLTYNTAMTPLTFTQSGGNGTITWSASGLPPGLAVNSSTGALSGTPTATGTFSGSVTATDAGGCSGSKAVSIAVAAVVPAQSYTGVGNTQFFITGAAGAPATPAVSSTAGLLTGVSPSAGTSVVSASCSTGGTLTAVDATGHFIFTPNVLATTAACSYSVSSDSGATGTAVSVAASVTFTLSGTVWYVDSASAGTHDGRSNTPFLNLGSGAGNLGSVATAVGDTIYVAKGSGTTAGSRTLLASQSLIGAGATLSVGALSVAGNAANTPTLGGTITIAAGVTINGISLSTGSSAALTGSGTGINVTIASLNTVGAANAINLSSATGSLTVNGGFLDGSTSNAVTLSGALSISFNNLTINDSVQTGISGTGLSGVSLTNCSLGFSGAGGSGHGLYLLDTTGAISIVGTSITTSHGNNLWIDTSSGSTAAITSLALTGTTLSSSTNADGLLVTLHGTSSIAGGVIGSCTMSSNFSYGLNLVANDNSSIGNVNAGIVAGAVTVNNSTFQSNVFGAGFAAGGGTGASNMYARFTNNILTAQSSHAVNVVSGASSTGGTQNVLISGNTIGNAAIAGSGSASGEGIVVTQQGQTTQSVTVTNNIIRQVPNGHGIDVQALGPVAAGANSANYPINYVLTGNDVDPGVAVGPLYAIYVAVDDQGSPTHVNTRLSSNTVPTTAACDTFCTPSTGMIFYQLLNGASTGLLYNPGGNPTVSGEIANTNTGTTGKTCSNGALAVTGTSPTVVN